MNQRLPLRALLVLAVLTAAHGGTFYVDCAAGNDAHDGLSPSSAFGTLAAISSRTFAPGDQILLNRGTTCKGIFSALGSGTPTAPIVLGAYGSGAAPIINGGTYIAAVWLFNQQGWHIENLETTGGTLYGIHIGGDSGPLTHFRITNVAVHDVNGALTTKDSGLIVISPAANGATFNDVVIDGASAWSTTQWAGIVVMGASYQGNMDGPHGLNVTVRNSIVHDVYGDGIVLSMVQGGLIEKSSAWRTGGQPTETIGTPGGIWTWMCNNCTSQFNESWLSTSPGVDGGAFDIDWGTRNNVVQFNYGHDAKGYCASVFGAETLTTSNATVQYNVCVNNARDSAMALRQGDIFLSTWDNGHLDGVSIHDNAIYRLGDGLSRLEAFKFPVMLTATTRASLAALADLDPGPMSADMKAVAQPQPDLAAAERLSQNVFMNAILRTTCVATLISGGHAENALPQRARATVQCRMMPGDTEANVQNLLVATLNDPKIKVTLDAPPIVSPESVPTPQIMSAVASVVHSMWPGVPIIPTMATGYSDDRQTRNAGIPSYDVSGIWMDGEENRAHGRDERVGVRSFDESVEFTYRLLKIMGRYK